MAGAVLPGPTDAVAGGVAPVTRAPFHLAAAPKPIRHKGHPAAPHSSAHPVSPRSHGAGEDGSAGDRAIVAAATWTVDPSLLRPTSLDSAATSSARARLATLVARIRSVLAAYDDDRVAARRTAGVALRARSWWHHQQRITRLAGARYERSHARLVQIVDRSYVSGGLASLQVLLAAQDTNDLLAAMTAMNQVGANESSVVSEDHSATLWLHQTRQGAHRADVAARAAARVATRDLGRVTVSRQRLLTAFHHTRTALATSVLADEATTSLAAALRYADSLHGGEVTFPLPAGTQFRDQHNWGHHSSHWARMHTGDDYSTSCGTPVLAATAGTVVVRTDQHWAGRWLVVISTGDGRLATWYAHMEMLTVTPGQQVSPGDRIGLVGRLGNTTGCHLHFEFHPRGGSIYADTQDPDPWLTTVGAYPS